MCIRDRHNAETARDEAVAVDSFTLEEYLQAGQPVGSKHATHSTAT